MQNLLIHLNGLGIEQSHIPIPLYSPDQEDEDTEDVDTDQILQKLAGKICITKYHWQCRWHDINFAHLKTAALDENFICTFLDGVNL